MLRIIGGKAQSLSFNGYANSGAFSASYSFGGMSLGQESSERLIVVCVANHSVNVPGAVTAVSVAGVAATRQGGTGPNPYTSIWSALVPTGTSGTVSLSLADKGTDMTIAVYSVYGLFSTTAYHVTTTHQIIGTGQLNLSVPARGMAIVIAVQDSSPGGAKGVTWTYPELELNPSGDLVNAAGSVNTASRAGLPETPIFTVQATPASGIVSMVSTTWR
jgi:hypothetical protein